MNYITELNAFYARLLVRPLSSEAQALWNVLLHLFNRAGWPPQLTVAASTLLGFLGYSYATLSRARSELVAAGLLVADRGQVWLDGRVLTNTEQGIEVPPPQAADRADGAIRSALQAPQCAGQCGIRATEPARNPQDRSPNGP